MSEIESYISGHPVSVQQILREIRQLIMEIVPEAEEVFAYQMPGYRTFGKPLVYFAAFKNHIGFYATPTGHTAFKAELAQYKQGKGSVQFPLNEPIPYSLIEKIVRFRKEENQADFEKKKAALLKKKTRFCEKGHVFYKSSDCPVCPQCENLTRTSTDFFSALAAPARRALLNEGIHHPKQLSRYSEKEILKLHGLGKSSLPILKSILLDHGLTFKSNEKPS